MKSSINTIKFLAVLSVVLMLLTYSISLNDENRWIVLDTPWLSNSFAFAIVGGSFASSLVVLACELQKYQSIKRQTEDYIFGQLFSLYAQVTIIHYNTKRQLNDISSPVPINLIDEIANRGKMCLLEKPREFDPRGQATMPPAGKNTLTPYGKIKMTPENDCFSGAFL